MLAQLKLDEGAKLEFSMAISGTNEPPECRFVVDLGSMQLMLPCVSEGDQITVEVPPLKNFTQAGDKQVRLEVVIDGKLFVPMKDVINFEPCIEIESKAKPVIKPEEMVKVGNVVVKKNPVVAPIEESTDKDGYLVIKKK
jgi:hypothetical protein